MDRETAAQSPLSDCPRSGATPPWSLWSTCYWSSDPLSSSEILPANGPVLPPHSLSVPAASPESGSAPPSPIATWLVSKASPQQSSLLTSQSFWGLPIPPPMSREEEANHKGGWPLPRGLQGKLCAIPLLSHRPQRPQRTKQTIWRKKTYY